jgi:flagellar hook assembly protein FlgD
MCGLNKREQKMKTLALLSLLFSTLVIYGAELVGTPTITSVGSGQWQISFEVNEASDVTVDILDSTGKVLRHIGTGVLGTNAPEPFTPNTLSQTIAWDGTDDKGQVVTVTQPILRVRVGLSLEFSRYVRKQAAPPLRNYNFAGLAVDSDRNLIVAASVSSRPSTHVAVYSPQGDYVKTLYPFPADMDVDSVEDFMQINKDGQLTPMIHHRLTQALAPGFVGMTHMTMDITPDNQMVMVSGNNMKEYTINNSLVVLNADGTIPRSRISGPSLSCQGYLHVGLQPGGDTVYYTGALNAVFKAPMNPNGSVSHFAGTINVAGNDSTHLNGPRGLAVDNAGNVYVSDFGNRRIMVYAPNGSVQGILPLAEQPTVLKVHPATGAIYVVTWVAGTKGLFLDKYDSYLSTSRSARYYIGTQSAVDTKEWLTVSMALDPHGDSTVVYLGANTKMPFVVGRLAENGTTFTLSHVRGLQKTSANSGQLAMHCANPEKDRIYFTEYTGGSSVAAYTYDGHSDAFGTFAPKLKIYDKKIYRGRDGYFYKIRNNRVLRMTEAGAIVPFSATGDSSDYIASGTVDRFDGRDNLFISAEGNIYGVYFHNARAGGNVKVSVLGPDGRLKEPLLIGSLSGARCIQMDPQGNLYIADNLKPLENSLPESIASLDYLDDVPSPMSNEGTFRNILMSGYGSIMKFSSSGGTAREIAPGAALQAGETEMTMMAGETHYAVSGLLGVQSGVSFMPPKKGVGPAFVCNCYGVTYDIDPNGRIIVPDAVQHKVTIYDANFNRITEFGQYDNRDNPGGKASGNRPDIPLELPMHVAGTDQVIYISNYGTRFITEYSFSTNNIVRVAYQYEDTYLSDTVHVSIETRKMPVQSAQLICQPNPSQHPVIFFNISGQYPVNGYTLSIYDARGQLVKTMAQGQTNRNVVRGSFSWNGTNSQSRRVGAGTYFAVLEIGSVRKTARFNLVR